jgi:hypothetical protein
MEPCMEPLQCQNSQLLSGSEIVGEVCASSSHFLLEPKSLSILVLCHWLGRRCSHGTGSPKPQEKWSGERTNAALLSCVLLGGTLNSSNHTKLPFPHPLVQRPGAGWDYIFKAPGTWDSSCIRTGFILVSQSLCVTWTSPSHFNPHRLQILEARPQWCFPLALQFLGLNPRNRSDIWEPYVTRQSSCTHPSILTHPSLCW